MEVKGNDVEKDSGRMKPELWQPVSTAEEKERQIEGF